MPSVFTAKTVMVCVPGLAVTAAESDVEVVSVYSFAESTQISMRASVPVMFEVACTSADFEEMEEPSVGAQMFTSGEVGALHSEGTVKLKS